MKAWLFQDKRGGDSAPWCVGWYDTDGKRRRKKVGLKTAAEAFRRKVERDLAQGLSGIATNRKWNDFLDDFRAKVMIGMEPGTRQATQHCIDHFVRICNPVVMRSVTT